MRVAYGVGEIILREAARVSAGEAGRVGAGPFIRAEMEYGIRLIDFIFRIFSHS